MNKKIKSLLSAILVLALVVCFVTGCSKDDTKTESNIDTTVTENKDASKSDKTKSDAPVLGEDVKLNSGEIVKKDDIAKEAEAYIPDTLPKEIETVEDLIKYNDYVETLPDGREKELLLLKMQLFLEKIQ